MGIVFAGKVFAEVMNDNINTYYSDPECNAKLGAGEKFYAEVRASNLQSTPSLVVGLQSSNDNVNWKTRTATVISTGTLEEGMVKDGSDLGVDAVGGRFQRFTLKFSSGTNPGAYIELWVTARNAY